MGGKEERKTEYIKDWLKTILYMNVLLLICTSLIQKTKYESYLRFFSGFLMMMCLIKPLIDFAGAGRYLDASFIQNQLKNQWKIIEQSEDLQKMEKDIRLEYEQAAEKQVKELGLSFSIEVTDIDTRWEKDDMEIKSLDIEGKEMEKGETPQIHEFRQALEQFYHLDSECIDIVVED